MRIQRRGSMGGPVLVPGCVSCGASYPVGIYSALSNLGLTANLVSCIDLADSGCYGGTGTTVTNKAAGAPSMAVNGTLSFAGTAGNLDGYEYLNLGGAGASYLRYNSNPANLNPGTKGTSFTIASWALPTAGIGIDLFSNSGYSGDILYGGDPWSAFCIDSGGVLWLRGCYDNGGAGSNSNGGIYSGYAGANNHISFGCWNLIAVSVAEGVTNGAFLYVNGNYAQIDATAVPGTTTVNTQTPANTATLSWYASAAGVAPYIDGNYKGACRLGAAMHWQSGTTSGGNLSKAQLDSIWNATRSRFGW